MKHLAVFAAAFCLSAAPGALAQSSGHDGRTGTSDASRHGSGPRCQILTPWQSAHGYSQACQNEASIWTGKRARARASFEAGSIVEPQSFEIIEVPASNR